jgi:SAM-dependent methyltransferase
MPQASSPEAPWFVRAFDRTWLTIYAHRGDEEAEAACPGIVRLLGARANDRVLDVGCGGGRYARALARRGLRVTGVDLSEDLLAVARTASPHLPGKPDYLRRDARHLPFARQFRAAISMFTSFGYFDDRADDLAIFRGVARALVPGGRFLVDYLNEARVRADLVAEEEVADGPLRLRFVRRIEDTPAGPCVFKRVEASEPESERVQAAFEERVRLYTCAEIDDLLAEAGFVPSGRPLGGVDGEPFDERAPRLVRLAAVR